MADAAFNLDIRGMLDAEQLLGLLELPVPKRKRLLNNVSKRVRSLSRQRIRDQENLDGSPFAPRKDKGKSKKRMEAGLGKLLDVTRSSPVLTMERIAYDNNGAVIEAGSHSYRPDLYSFEIMLVSR